ncbi:TetR/AcrR family transcriptional regulator [Actinomadura sp. 1N219]|uniref:TetR/AcrR family transcriptional regulator n=1 Tax=Actinomadura sp. 1N219 TaxID=3375152 RepID=UPI0037AB3FA4
MSERSQSSAGESKVDQRLVRGERSRRNITRRAVDIASVEGLHALSIGRLAGEIGLSKSGVQSLFGTKENLQLAVVESAEEQFGEAVVQPAMAEPEGAARVRALIENWITYATTPLFVGGCFWSQNLPEFDSRPGRVRDALFAQHRDWLDLIAGELRYAIDAGQIAEVDAELAAFQIAAVLAAANSAVRVGDDDAVRKARRVVDGLLVPLS